MLCTICNRDMEGHRKWNKYCAAYAEHAFIGENMMNMMGRWYTRNKTLVAVHLNEAALPGNREERWIGHIIPNVTTSQEMLRSYPSIKFCWNENGECVWVQGIVDDTKNYDLMENVSGKDLKESRMKVRRVVKQITITGSDDWVERMVVSHFPDGEQKVLGGGTIEIKNMQDYYTTREVIENGKEDGS
jgi:hypothetical protein